MPPVDALPAFGPISGGCLFLLEMASTINRRLLRSALISSPIIGLYGAMPILLLSTMPPRIVLIVAGSITLNVFLFWMINIFLLHRFANRPGSAMRYLISYGITFVLHAAFLFIQPGPPFPEVRHTMAIIYPLIAILGINSLVLLIANSILLTQQKQNVELEMEQLKVEQLEAQKQMLMQQLQPHFLFNTLSVLKSMIRDQADAAEEYAVRLSDFLRYTVRTHQRELVSLAEELRFTEDYLALQKARFGQSLLCQIDVPLHIRLLHVPAFALQTLVENSIKHNQFTDKRPLYITIRHEEDTIIVCNNKAPKPFVETNGTGLQNLNERYRLITGDPIEIRDETHEFCVRVKLVNI